MPGTNGKNKNGKRRLTDSQMKIARVAEPRDRITAVDFAKLRQNKNRTVT